MSITVNTRGAHRVLDRLGDRLGAGGLAILGSKMAQLLTESTLEAFDQQTDPVTGTRWAPRKYERRYRWGTRAGRQTRVRVQSRKTLIQTGTLRRASQGQFKVERHGGGYRIRVQGVIRAQRNSRTGRTAADYGHFHQFGIGVPRRRFLGYSNKYKLRVRRVAREHMKAAL